MKLHHVQVSCAPDTEPVARRFYGDGLGMVEVEKPQDLRSKGGVWFRAYDESGGVTAELHVGVQDPFSPALKAHPALQLDGVPQLEVVAERLVDLGFAVDWRQRHSLPGYERHHTADGQGNRVELLALVDSP